MLALEPSTGNPGLTQTLAAQTERDIHAALTPANPPRRPSMWLKSPTLSVRAAGGTASPADFPQNHARGTDWNKNRASPQPDPTLHGLFSFGDNWHRSLPQEAAKVPCVDFFFSLFIVQSEWKQWHLAATFHQCYCYSLVVGICFPSGEMQRRQPSLEEHEVRDVWGNSSKWHTQHYPLRFLGCGNTSQQNNVLAHYVRFAKLLPTFQINY